MIGFDSGASCEGVGSPLRRGDLGDAFVASGEQKDPEGSNDARLYLTCSSITFIYFSDEDSDDDLSERVSHHSGALTSGSALIHVTRTGPFDDVSSADEEWYYEGAIEEATQGEIDFHRAQSDMIRFYNEDSREADFECPHREVLAVGAAEEEEVEDQFAEDEVPGAFLETPEQFETRRRLELDMNLQCNEGFEEEEFYPEPESDDGEVGPKLAEGRDDFVKDDAVNESAGQEGAVSADDDNTGGDDDGDGGWDEIDQGAEEVGGAPIDSAEEEGNPG